MPLTLSDTTLRLLEDLPPFERGSKDVQGALDVCARQIDRFDAAVVQVRNNFFPATADVLLGFYEAELGLSVNPPDKTIDQRRQSVTAYMLKLRSSGSGLSWQQNLTALIGSGWSYEEHDPADGTSPPANTIRILLPFSPEIAVPAQPTATPGTGGSLPAATYTYAVTATNFYGETTISPTRTATTAASGSVALDWPDVTGASGYVVYRGPNAGALQRIAVVSVSNYSDLGGQTPGTPPPTSNTTESFLTSEAKVLARKVTPAHVDLVFGYTAGFLIGVSAIGDTL